MARHKDVNWLLPDRMECNEQVLMALLMDVRDELKSIGRQLNVTNDRLRVLSCSNFLAIPHVLRSIRANTAKRRAKR